ncbi:MAG: hypothetical protein KAJ51_02020, partial [Thermoplasmata archaeon]|nr:hypothetical protein [Thermoplasmata archaeon]
SGLKPRPEGILESFGLIRSIPILDIIWIISILSLILTVEFNLFINFNNEIFKGQEPLVGITILGFLLGLFFSYIHYEFKTLNIEEQSGTSKSFRDLIKISVLILIGIFVIIVMVLQLLDFRGMVAIIDSLGIMAVTCGTYGILVKNRVMIIPIVLILVVIGVLKVNYSPDILLLILLSGLALFYILISDTSIQYYLQIKKIRDSYKSSDLTKFDLHYDRILTNYLKFLTLFILLSTLIVGFLYV